MRIYKDFASSHIPGGSQSQSSTIVGITSTRQGQSPIKKRARFIPPSIVNSSAQLVETSYRQQGARTHTHKDNKIQLSHMQKRRSPRLKATMNHEEDNQIERNGVEGDQNETQIKSSTQLAKTSYTEQCARTHHHKDNKIQLTHIQKRRSPRLKVAMANEEDNGVEGNEVEGDQNKTQNEEQQGPEIQEKQPSNIETSSEGEVESIKSKTRGPTLCAMRASKENHDSPSQAEIFVTTCRGNQRKQLDAETSNKIDKIQLQPSNLYLELRSMTKFVVMEEMSLYLL
ncbi:uncharacterized protein G2W53_022020 [Senna tora]|uniref:Uncharacterized protein n=1 Tax=Senna tora TaxID=362788 RepID=A0A834TMS9_9FABA|nr:uncharacterized protein G2W53_022020 [Senna tora]